MPRVFRVQYDFEDTPTYERKLRDRTYTRADGNRVYWRDFLFLAHLVVSAALHRTCRLVDASVRERRASSLPGWASCTRALLEAVGDANTTLRGILSLLPEKHRSIRRCLEGRENQIVMISSEVEDLMTHFTHARRLAKGEKQDLPSSHQAKPAAEYIRELAAYGIPDVPELYSELCAFSHPAAPPPGAAQDRLRAAATPHRAGRARAVAEEAQDRRLNRVFAAAQSRRRTSSPFRCASTRARSGAAAPPRTASAGTPQRPFRALLRETSRNATRPLRETKLAPTLGKGPDGRFPQRGGSLSPLNAHNMARARCTHAARLRNATRLTPAPGLLGCAPIPMYRTVHGSRKRGHRMVPPPFQTTGVRPRQGHQPTARLTNTGARRKGARSRQQLQPATAGNPAGAGSDRSHGPQPSRLTKTGVRNRRASGSTDPRNSARSVPQRHTSIKALI